jgi:DNA topoisomerase-1
MDMTEIEGTQQEKRLYDLIWKRTVASQMADAQIEKTTVTINVSSASENFIASGEVIVFDGFLKVYRESTDDEDNNQDDFSHTLPAMSNGDELQRREITSTERSASADHPLMRRPSAPSSSANTCRRVTRKAKNANMK